MSDLKVHLLEHDWAIDNGCASSEVVDNVDLSTLYCAPTVLEYSFTSFITIRRFCDAIEVSIMIPEFEIITDNYETWS